MTAVAGISSTYERLFLLFSDEISNANIRSPTYASHIGHYGPVGVVPVDRAVALMFHHETSRREPDPGGLGR